MAVTPDAIMTVLAAGPTSMLSRPCVDCGQITGRYCDHCLAADRIQNEQWAQGQQPPLCSECDNQHDMCHFCRGLTWVRPPAWRRGG